MREKDIDVIKGIKTMDTAYTGPYGVQIGVTGECNYKCKFCGLFSGLNRNPNYKKDERKRISLTEFKQLIDECRKMAVQQISLVGWGEPLLHPDITEMIEYVKESDLKCMLTTNASLLTDNKVMRFIEAGLDIMYISLNAGNNKTYKKIHGIRQDSLFNDVRSILRRLYVLKSERGSSVPLLGLRIVICKDNFREVREVCNVAKEVGADSLIFQEWGGYACDEPMALDDNDMEELLKELKAAKSALNPNIRNNIEYFEWRLGCLLTEGGSYKQKEMAYPCYVGWTYAMILHNGDIFPCCNCTKLMGNIYNNDFTAIWNSQTYREFRKQTVNILNVPYEDEQCSCYSTCGSIEHNKRMHETMLEWNC